MSPLNFKTAHQLAQMIRDRTVSSTEVPEAHCAQIAKYNSRLHAICTLDEENARIKAKQADDALTKGALVEQWYPPNFDLSEIFNLYTRLAAYINIYAQPIDRYNLQRSFKQIFRTATQGEKSLRQLGDFSRVLPELLNPGLKGYFAALTDRDRFIAQLEMALEDWDVWLTPVAATVAFTHRPAWSAVEVDGRSYPHAVANGAYTMPFSLSGHPAIVIPIGQTSLGLPIGLQIIGKCWKEMELLEIAQQIDRVVGRFQLPFGNRDEFKQ